MSKTVDINTKEEVVEDVNESMYTDQDPETEPKTTVEEAPNDEYSEEPKGAKEVFKNKEEKDIPLEVFKVGNLKFKCHCCGHEYVIEEGVQGGIRFDLYATNKHKLALACPQCKAVLEMYFEKGDDSGLVDIDGKAIKKSTSNSPDITDEVLDAEEQEPESEGIDGEMMADKDLEMSEEMTEETKEEISKENKNVENEVSVQEENKQETPV